MIVLKTTVQQIGGDLADAYLSDIDNSRDKINIRDRQDFELRRASPIEFDSEDQALSFLDSFFDGKLHYSTGFKIFRADIDRPKHLWFLYEIEEV